MKIKMVTLALLLAMFSAACGVNEDGRGNGIEDCGTEGTSVEASFDDPQGAENPAHLAEFNSKQIGRDRVYASGSTFIKSGDLANEVGEIACHTEDGTIVLTGVGNQIRSNLPSS